METATSRDPISGAAIRSLGPRPKTASVAASTQDGPFGLDEQGQMLTHHGLKISF
jgi:hypothetical protein